MIPYLAEIVTIIAIATILAVYLILLRRNGWLGGGDSDLFRCPNQQCKRVFQNPVEMKDLSKTPARVYPACPHCGNDLGQIIASLAGSKTGNHKAAFRQEKPETQIKASIPRNRNEEPKIVGQKEASQLCVPKSIESVKTETGVGENKPLPAVPQTPKSSLNVPREPEIVNKQPEMQVPNPPVTKETKGVSNVQASKDGQAGCSHFFGYLHTLQKAALIPNACYSCPRIVDCYCKKTDSGTTS